MPLVEEKETTNGSCPVCQTLWSIDDIARNLRGELADGYVWMTCMNCQAESTVEVKLTHARVLNRETT